MSKIDDGWSNAVVETGDYVYPPHFEQTPYGSTVKLAGITRRDYYAGLAMQAIYGGIGAQQVANRDERYDETNWAEVVALNAYEMADAMIAQGKKQGA